MVRDKVLAAEAVEQLDKLHGAVGVGEDFLDLPEMEGRIATVPIPRAISDDHGGANLIVYTPALSLLFRRVRLMAKSLAQAWITIIAGGAGSGTATACAGDGATLPNWARQKL